MTQYVGMTLADACGGQILLIKGIFLNTDISSQILNVNEWRKNLTITMIEGYFQNMTGNLAKSTKIISAYGNTDLGKYWLRSRLAAWHSEVK